MKEKNQNHRLDGLNDFTEKNQCHQSNPSKSVIQTKVRNS